MLKVKVIRLLVTGIILTVFSGLLAACGFIGIREGLTNESEIPSFDNAAKLFPRPGSKRIYIHQPCDYKIVQVRPDFKLQIKDAIRHEYVTGFGFVILKGNQVKSFDFNRTRQVFVDSAIPILKQSITQDGFVFEQISYTTNVDNRPLIMVRMCITPENMKSPGTIKLAWLTVRQPHRCFHSHSNEDYIVFEPWAEAWESRLNLRYKTDFLYDGETVSLAIRNSANVFISSGSNFKGALDLTISFDDAEEAVIDLVIPYECLQRPVDAEDHGLQWRADKAFHRGEEKHLAAISFDDEQAKQAKQWQQHLKRAAQIHVPEPIVNQVYRTLTLNNLQFLGSSNDVAYLRPGQGGFNNFSVVYGWESSHFLTVMDKQGFHDETRRVLDYFLTTQQGSHGPEGDISTADGCFRPHIHWMCETGAILLIFADHALYSKDSSGFHRDFPALIKAARWIQGQRARTKQLDSNGKKVLHYGLMPPGRAADWPDYGYFIFTDAATWQGLDRLARAYEAAKMPEAGWLREEADDYHQCILDAISRSLKPHPLDPSLQWIPDELYEDPAKVLPTTIFTGPQSLLSAGVLVPEDPLFSMIERMLRRAGCLSDHFAFRMKTMEDAELKQRQEKSAGGEIDLYYVTNCEQAWHHLWIQRGERIKALRFFYMTLAYATSRDVHVTHERYSPQLPWLLPWQPNASGNGRIMEMILNSLVLEQRNSLCLLFGAPDTWFDTGQPLGVTGLRTSWGRFSFQLTPEKGKHSRYRFSYECEGTVPKRFLLAIPTDEGKEQRRIVEILSSNRKSATQII